ncbi:late competence development ComFB family protein [Anaerotignum sp.]|uniref:late competence development ComFB family protein n=1 Tax=Anaerotignum sp. TaxID=2039241 RepID=UPI0027148D65|nr:late competence development ComFB family protein [Anaerotignum sp.]
MARKTNKTAHVLNLISKAKDEHQAMEEQMKIDNTGSDVSNDLLFMGIEPSNDKSISEEIDENLKAFVEQDEKTSLTPEEKDELPKNEETTQQNMPEINSQPTPGSDTEQERTEYPAKNNLEAETENKIPAENQMEAENTPMPSYKNNTVQISETLPTPEFHYVNVYEKLVLERLEEFQTMFDICTCPRCTADVIAIALTNLPAKYVVTDNPRIIPLLSFYREKFKTAVTAQLSNACVVVKQKPLH